jgi:hypothetical protein
MLTEVTGEGEDFMVKVEEWFEAGMVGRNTGSGEGFLKMFDMVLWIAAIH